MPLMYVVYNGGVLSEEEEEIPELQLTFVSPKTM